MRKETPIGNKYLYDCRRYIKPGDHVIVDSMWCCDQSMDSQRHDAIPHAGTVVAVYEKFIRVKLRRVTECVNRWDILELNGRDVMNGRFSGHEVRA